MISLPFLGSEGEDLFARIVSVRIFIFRFENRIRCKPHHPARGSGAAASKTLAALQHIAFPGMGPSMGHAITFSPLPDYFVSVPGIARRRYWSSSMILADCLLRRGLSAITAAAAFQGNSSSGMAQSSILKSPDF